MGSFMTISPEGETELIEPAMPPRSVTDSVRFVLNELGIPGGGQ